MAREDTFDARETSTGSDGEETCLSRSWCGWCGGGGGTDHTTKASTVGKARTRVQEEQVDQTWQSAKCVTNERWRHENEYHEEEVDTLLLLEQNMTTKRRTK